MPQPNVEPEEIIEKFDLPSSEKMIEVMGLSRDILDKEIASTKDFYKKGNNPPSYSNVRSISEFIEDEYDGFVQNLYQQGETEISFDELLNTFKQQLDRHLPDYVVVKNTGRAYLADEDDQTILKFK